MDTVYFAWGSCEVAALRTGHMFLACTPDFHCVACYGCQSNPSAQRCRRAYLAMAAGSWLPSTLVEGEAFDYLYIPNRQSLTIHGNPLQWRGRLARTLGLFI